jgi:hypothetical protein
LFDELLLEPLSDVEMLPLEAEPALDADDAKLSARAWALRPAASRAAIKRWRAMVMVRSWWGNRLKDVAGQRSVYFNRALILAAVARPGQH